MSKEKLNSGYYPTIVLLIVCVISTALLAFTNELTMEAREEQKRQAELLSKQIVFPEADEFREVSLPDGSPDAVKSLEEAYQGDKLIGYLISSESRGYGGAVPVKIGINDSGEISGLDLPANNETPGLGQKVRDENFKTQFINGNAEQDFSVSAGNNEVQIDAITGATVSSQAVVDSVNSALQLYRDFLKE